MSQPTSFYEAVGGEETFRRLVHRFYQGVAEDPVLRPVYPAQDLGPAEEHLALFLIQYWGGPRTYDDLRGHPRLRMRHARFAIGEAERDAWLHHMRVALDELALDGALDAQLWDYLVMAAQSLVNVLGALSVVKLLPFQRLRHQTAQSGLSRFGQDLCLADVGRGSGEDGTASMPTLHTIAGEPPLKTLPIL